MSDIATQLAAIVVLGIAAQLIADRLRVPSILLLLSLGLVAGPVTGSLDPDELLGQMLAPRGWNSSELSAKYCTPSAGRCGSSSPSVP